MDKDDNFAVKIPEPNSHLFDSKVDPFKLKLPVVIEMTPLLFTELLENVFVASTYN